MLGAIPNVIGFITGANTPISLRMRKPRLRGTNLPWVIGIVREVEPWSPGWAGLDFCREAGDSPGAPVAGETGASSSIWLWRMAERPQVYGKAFQLVSNLGDGFLKILAGAI